VLSEKFLFIISNIHSREKRAPHQQQRVLRALSQVVRLIGSENMAKYLPKVT